MTIYFRYFQWLYISPYFVAKRPVYFSNILFFDMI